MGFEVSLMSTNIHLKQWVTITVCEFFKLLKKESILRIKGLTYVNKSFNIQVIFLFPGSSVGRAGDC